ncbi:hypothetical protein Micbo1qcDRAFT_155047, partial [Microdochium bolleyi]
MPYFIRDDVSDLDLPLVAIKDEHGTLQDVRRRADTDQPLYCFSDWTLTQLEKLCTIQWRFTAPKFQRSERGEVQYHHLEDSEVL